MAKDWKLDEYGDIDMSTGDIEWVEDEDEVAQLAETKLLKCYDEDFLELETGITWLDSDYNQVVMYDHNRDMKYKALLLKAAMLQIPEVTDITKLTISLDDDTGVQSIETEIDTIYSDEPLQVG